MIEAGAVRDALGVNHRPGAIAIDDQGSIIAAGSVDHVKPLATTHTRVLSLPDQLVMPALVNAHAHLDLSFLGPQAYDGNFVGWLSRITELRLGGQSVDCITQSVHDGLRQSYEQGVGYVGDVAGSVHAVMARDVSSVKFPGVSYLECFGVGRGQVDGFIRLQRALAELPRSPKHFKVGLSPHAPYTAGLALYLAVTRLAEEKGYPLCTHLAESPAEIEFVRDLKGLFVDRRKQLGKWDDTLAPTGQHPIDWLQPALRRTPWLVAHANFADENHLRPLAFSHTSVVYCPRASDYFGFPTGAGGGGGGVHPYRAMLQAGVNVCLGTDSILCQPPASIEPQPMSMLAQMRYLYQRDQTEPDLLLRMATVNGLQALGLPSCYATLQPGTPGSPGAPGSPGCPARLIQVRFDVSNSADPLQQVLMNRELVQPMVWVDAREKIREGWV